MDTSPGALLRRLAMTAFTVAAWCSMPAHAVDAVLVVDQPDVQKLKVIDQGPRLSEFEGAEVRGNAGKRIGEIEDFVIARGGYLYAIVDTSDGPLEELVDLVEEETIVIPWDELRRFPGN